MVIIKKLLIVCSFLPFLTFAMERGVSQIALESIHTLAQQQPLIQFVSEPLLLASQPGTSSLILQSQEAAIQGTSAVACQGVAVLCSVGGVSGGACTPNVGPGNIVPVPKAVIQEKSLNGTQEYYHAKINENIISVRRCLEYDESGTPYIERTTCFLSAEGRAQEKTMAQTCCIYDQQDMVREAVYGAQEYLALQEAGAIKESSLVVFSEDAAHIPSMGAVVHLYHNDSAAYGALAQFAAGKIPFEEISACTQQLREAGFKAPKISEKFLLDVGAFSAASDCAVEHQSVTGALPHVETTTASSQNCQQGSLYFVPIEQQKNAHIEGTSRDASAHWTGKTQAGSAQISCGVQRFVSTDSGILPLPSVDETLKDNLPRIYEKVHAARVFYVSLHDTGISVANMTEQQLVEGQTKMREAQQALNQALHSPVVFNEQKPYVSKWIQDLQHDIDVLQHIHDQRSGDLRAFQRGLAIKPLSYLITQEKRLKTSIAVQEPKVHEQLKTQSGIASSVSKNKQQLRFYGPSNRSMVRRMFNSFYDWLNTGSTEQDLAQCVHNGMAQLREITPKVCREINELDQKKVQLFMVQQAIDQAKQAHAMHQKALIGDQLEQLRELRGDLAKTPGALQQEAVKAIDTTLANQGHLIITNRCLDEQLHTYIVDRGGNPDVFMHAVESHIGSYIRNVNMGTIRSVQGLQGTGDSPITKEIAKNVVIACERATQLEQAGDYVEALRVTEQARRLLDVVTGSQHRSPLDTVCIIEGEAYKSLPAQGTDYYTCRSLQAIRDRFPALEHAHPEEFKHLLESVDETAGRYKQEGFALGLDELAQYSAHSNFDQQVPHLRTQIARASGKQLNPLQQARVQAAQRALDENGKISLVCYTLTPQAEQYLADRGIDPKIFSHTVGNRYECQAVEESVEIFNDLVGTLHDSGDNKSEQVLAGLGLDFVMTARDRSAMGCTEQAQTYNDYARACNGSCQVLKNQRKEANGEATTSQPTPLLTVDKLLEAEREHLDEILLSGGAEECLTVAIMKAPLDIALLQGIADAGVDLANPANIILGPVGLVLCVGQTLKDETVHVVEQAGFALAAQYYQVTNPALAEHFRQKRLASTDPTVLKIKEAVNQWGAMSAEERMRSFSRFAMNAGLARTAADIHVNTGLSFLNSFGATASEGLSKLLNSFPPALQPVAAGELAIPVPVGVDIVSWTPVAVGDSVAGFIKAAHGGSLALRSFTLEANNRSGGSREIVLPKVKTFEQARNKALEIVDGLMGSDSKPYVCTLKTSAAYGKIVGRISADSKVRWRLDWDPIKGLHINVENFRCGKGCKAKKFVIPFDGTEEMFIALIKQFN
jgi:hypothetical protein